MTVPSRLAPLLAEYDFTSTRLLQRLSGPTVDSGDDEQVPVEPLTDAELLWEPVPGAWTIRRQTDGPGGLGATRLVGAGEWGHDGGRPHPWPPPVTSIGWRINHVAKTLAGTRTTPTAPTPTRRRPTSRRAQQQAPSRA